jgi:hypothetical protein
MIGQLGFRRLSRCTEAFDRLRLLQRASGMTMNSRSCSFPLPRQGAIEGGSLALEKLGRHQICIQRPGHCRWLNYSGFVEHEAYCIDCSSEMLKCRLFRIDSHSPSRTCKNLPRWRLSRSLPRKHCISRLLRSLEGTKSRKKMSEILCSPHNVTQANI